MHGFRFNNSCNADQIITHTVGGVGPKGTSAPVVGTIFIILKWPALVPLCNGNSRPYSFSSNTLRLTHMPFRRFSSSVFAAASLQRPATLQMYTAGVCAVDGAAPDAIADNIRKGYPVPVAYALIRSPAPSAAVLVRHAAGCLLDGRLARHRARKEPEQVIMIMLAFISSRSARKPLHLCGPRTIYEVQ